MSPSCTEFELTHGFKQQLSGEFCPLSADWHWTAQPERLHSAEVSDQQVWIQQLQLGGKLTSAVRAPDTVDRSKEGAHHSFRKQSPHINSLFLMQRFPSPVSWPSTRAALTAVGGGAVPRDRAL